MVPEDPPPRFCWKCGGDASEPDHARHCDGQQGHVEEEEKETPSPPPPPDNVRPFEPRAHARWTDPETSHAAADSLDPGTLNRIQGRVLDVLLTYRTMVDVDLVEVYRSRHGPTGSSTIRTRRRELVDLGLVEDSGERRTLASHRLAIVWRVTALAETRTYAKVK